MVEPSALTIIPAAKVIRCTELGLKSATSGFADDAIRQVGSKLDVWSALG